MKKLFLALALVAASTAASAADNANIDQLVAIRGELVNLHNNLLAMQAAQNKKQAERIEAGVCRYEDKNYTEGAIRQVGNIALVCVDKPYGFKMEGKTQLVWEPVTSKRLESYRQITGLK